jgi:hypothetical protein
MGNEILALSDLIAGARQHINDALDHHLYSDELSDLIDGVSLVYYLTNRNLVDKANDGAPLDPLVRVNNVVLVGATFDKQNGILTFPTAPNQGDLVVAQYYFELMTDDEYVTYAQGLQNFLGFAVTSNTSGRWTGPTDNSSTIPTLYTDAAVNFVASKAADQMANLSGWWYRANDGDKSFDKGAVSQHFKEMAINLKNEAEFSRDGVYTRQGRREAPAWGQSNLRPQIDPQPRR